MRTRILLAALALCLLWPAAASAGPRTCSEFDLTQTYRDGDWIAAPAWYYGQTVTVAYEARNCSFFQDKQGHFQLQLVGQATVYAGEDTSGAVLDVRPFHNTETWQDAANISGWPMNWWQCSVERAQYKWKIAGVYDFTVTAKHDVWTVQQTAFTSPPQRALEEYPCE